MRWFFLFSDVLIYAQEKRKAFVYKGSVNLFPAKFNLCVEDLPLSTCPSSHHTTHLLLD